MINIIRQWFHRYFSNPEAVLLVVILLLGFGLILLWGNILAPVLASIVLAYLLEWAVVRIQQFHVPRLVAVWIVFLSFLGLLFLAVIGLLPLIWKQLEALFQELPTMIENGQTALKDFLNAHPEYFAGNQTDDLMNAMTTDVRSLAKVVLSLSVASIAGIITWMVYLILVPLLLFFFLKDRNPLLNWLGSFLPHKRGVLREVSTEVNIQIGNYIRGKVAEIIIVGIATYIGFWFFDFHYAALLAFLVGLSVLIPYVGAIVITIPVILVGYFQWGFTSHFGYFLLVYLIIQGLDANILVPLLFSEAVNLHPVAIIVAVLFFGGIWGFWGVFFAIPLATLVKALINSWPKTATNHGH